MNIKSQDWEVLAASIEEKKALFEYAESKGVQILGGDEALKASNKEDEHLYIGYYMGLLSYSHDPSEDYSDAYTPITAAKFRQMCDAYAALATE